jgi:hypothetical protein
MSDENETPNPNPSRPGWTPPARKSRKGMSKRLKHSLDAHAETEAERRQSRQRTGTPDRDDVARATLHAVLRLLHARPDLDVPQKLRRYIISLLKEALFNKDEAERVIADMIDGPGTASRPTGRRPAPPPAPLVPVIPEIIRWRPPVRRPVLRVVVLEAAE